MAWYDNILDGIGDKINDIFKFTGEACADVLDTGIKYYNKFITFAYELVTKDIKDGAFQEFWDVVNFLNSVFISVATTLLVSMFFYSLFESSMESRAEVSMWRTVFDYLKLLIANLLVANSLKIVVGIFRFGTNIALYAVRTSTGNAVILNKDTGLDESTKELFIKGVTGVKGLLILVIALIGAVVMVASAVFIIIEILKRFFKMFAVMPFAALSFCTFVLPDNKGGEIFRGYIKNAIAVSLEAGIIVFGLVVSSALTSKGAASGGLMGELFKLGDSEIAIKTVELETAEEGEAFHSYCSLVVAYKNSDNPVINALGTNMNQTTDTPFYNELGVDFDSFDIVPKDINKVYEAMEKEDKANSINYKEVYNAMFPATGYAIKSLKFGMALVLVITCALPMILTAAVVKEVPSYASKVLGM